MNNNNGNSSVSIKQSPMGSAMDTKDYLATKQLAESHKDTPPTAKPEPQGTEKTVSDTPEKNPEPVAPAKESKEISDEKSEKSPEKSPINSEKPAVAPAPKLSDMEVMEHTASIWNYKEITDNGTEMHSEFHEKRSETSSAEVVAARVRGKKHKHEGTNCDDFFETAACDDFVVTVVCDGAGSKPLSRIGSRVSSESAVKFLKEELTKLFENKTEMKMGLCADMNSPEFMASASKIAALVQQSAAVAFKAQQDKLAELSKDEKYINALGREPIITDMYATFLAAVTLPLVTKNSKQVFMACVQIGDGCICAIDSTADSSCCLKLMGEADSGAFSGETDFLSEKNIRPEIIGGKTRVSRGSSDIIMLMSDGVADDYFPNIPMMERLYLDLCLNGILPMKGELTAGEDPAPIRFKSVSMSRQSVALQYARQLLSDNSEDAMKALWDKREALRCHSLEAFRMNIGDTPEERLRVWLDNYNERGSFDDRTLAIVRIKPNPDK